MEELTARSPGGERLERARLVLRMEAEAIRNLEGLLGDEFGKTLDAILACAGHVVVCGIGKAGLIGAKVSATLASTGTPSFFLHPSEAFHGDLGRVRREDIVLLLSNSGESEEVVQLIEPLRRIGATLVAMTGRADSRLGRNVDLLLDCGRAPEACPLGLAPTASTAALLALGDALAMALLEARDFAPEDYARYHPGGALGRKLMRVSEVMRTGDRVTTQAVGTTARDVLLAMNATKGRPGAAILVGREGKLAGFFTDGDLARALEAGFDFLARPVDEVMMTDPIVIRPDRLAAEAFRLLREKRIDQVPVVDAEGLPVGLVDVQDLLDARIVG